ncbi:hypothetical protein LOK49_LG04G01063 [Camellia lanceoleosa]|uniref:Uncharacterized protein n=1 Tax=Camellia lanceoleosa TaxID=1840588 RepID=A0ACC0I0D8_9ERIC|nr:hypothetical protein LOK49_LG04G01063 [Camellia lanceoleosa]
MQKAHRTGVQISTKSPEIISSEPMLVPPMIHRSNIPGKNQQKWRQRTQFINPHSLLQLHPFDNLPSIVPISPSLEINNHHTRVEITGFSIRKCRGKRWVGPKRRRKVGREVGVAVLRRGEDAAAERRGGEFGDVVDEDEVGVEVDDFSDAFGEEIGEVVASIVERGIERRPDGGGDEAGHGGGVEVVEAEVEGREGLGNGEAEEAVVAGGGGGGGDEVEVGVFRAGGVLEDGENGGHGAAEVRGVKGHCHVYCII